MLKSYFNVNVSSYFTISIAILAIITNPICGAIKFVAKVYKWIKDKKSIKIVPKNFINEKENVKTAEAIIVQKNE